MININCQKERYKREEIYEVKRKKVQAKRGTGKLFNQKRNQIISSENLA
jgi:hypothetical protein